MGSLSAKNGAWISTFAYLLVSLVKIIVAWQVNSVALMADGFNNFTDIITSVALIIGLRIAKKDQDENHPYGHRRAENITSLVAAFVIATIGIQILADTVRAILNQDFVTPDPLAIWVGLGSGLFMILIYFVNKTIASKVDSQGLRAIAKDNLSDSIVSFGTVVGIAGAQFGLSWLDPVTGTIIGLIILWAAWGIFKETALILTDGIDPEKIRQYKESISDVQEIVKVNDVKARVSGNKVIIDVAVTLQSDLPIKEMTQVSEKIKELMQKQHNSLMTFVEIKPSVK
ncbi:cation diffusion facilitator family transporter [Halobacillus shinanisalinarum]|uniref:Cation diffusion facilitator family transporter n=1 Tax=Halobacillus shinanisalinarum TaxID=2932258 RepID=A0ABY4H0K2_9BACI|nr:cation diffusion facilitator family transporter [Halobacillus shinanisalinarum]UOQ93971.1 cation diffusion facilitator family transporter [Halobacillus shinanisalinarum]